MSESIQEAINNLTDGLRAIDQQTWLIIAGVLLALAYFTRKSKRR